MRRLSVLVAGTSMALALPAFAQSASQQPGVTGGSSGSNQSTPIIAQKMTKDLENEGFTKVQVMPESFLVRAHDKQGRPVMMIVNPDSVLAVTSIGGSNQPLSSNSGSGTNGAGKSTVQ